MCKVIFLKGIWNEYQLDPETCGFAVYTLYLKTTEPWCKMLQQWYNNIVRLQRENKKFNPESTVLDHDQFHTTRTSRKKSQVV